ncbi:unnamed protein product [Phytomonas sp. Hart1]|nr:unnamed protein product [Phytomonas sp. Hart1]|eukprot:CCW68347.1 unnamed protein product [Phytomonas sp. isolate Hart1]
MAAGETQALRTFREYDRARRGYVKEGQFFACLYALMEGQPTPLEASILIKTLANGNREMAYERFCAEVDDEKFRAVS